MAPTATGSAPPILLVEDNQLNEIVALGLLRLLGRAADVAHDGAEAVTALRSHPYQIVLMDVAMPVLDGVGATRQIRAEFPAAQQPYIIAVTAHAMAEDRERCLAAGMNDYLSKPLAKARLAEALERAGATVVGTEPRTAIPVDRRQFDELAALASASGADLIRNLISTFGDRGHQLVATLRQAADPAEVIAAAHELQGSAGTIGATTVAGLARTIELAARARRLPQPDQLDGLAAELDRALSELVRLRDSDGRRDR